MKYDFQHVHREIEQFEKNRKKISPAGGEALLGYVCVMRKKLPTAGWHTVHSLFTDRLSLIEHQT